MTRIALSDYSRPLEHYLRSTPICDSWMISENQMLTTEGPVIWLHPRTAAKLVSPTDLIGQLEYILGVVVRDAHRRFDRAIDALDSEVSA